jgi:NADH:ubiquinone oxidoreductase subunit 2 (subunit N)
MGGVASSIILLALYFIYSTTGSTNLTDIIIYNSYSNSTFNNLSQQDIIIAGDHNFDILVIALLFKMGLAPLHR